MMHEIDTTVPLIIHGLHTTWFGWGTLRLLEARGFKGSYVNFEGGKSLG